MKKFLKLASRMSVRYFLLGLFYCLYFTPSEATPPSPQLYTVSLQPISQTLYYNGTLSPINNVPVISPTAGVIDKKNFNYGQLVKKGTVLMHVQTDKVLTDLWDAEIAYLNALADFDKLQQWDSSQEVMNAQDALTRAQRTFASANSTYEENKTLYQLEIISLQELNQSKDSYADAKMAVEEAKRALNEVLKQGQGNKLKVAQLQLDTAKRKYDSLVAQAKNNEITAPATGIVLQPQQSTGSSPSGNTDTSSNNNLVAGKLDIGSTISYQEVLLTIGDLSGLKINFSIPEIAINQVRIGQEAIVTGAGFPGITLKGVITEVGSQANTDGSGGGSLPTFPAQVEIKQLTPEQSKWIRSGMDAQIAITVFKKGDSLTIPVAAVSKNEQGASTVQRYDAKTKKTTPIVIQTGKVMEQNVEVLSGLKAGDQITLPA